MLEDVDDGLGGFPQLGNCSIQKPISSKCILSDILVTEYLGAEFFLTKTNKGKPLTSGFFIRLQNGTYIPGILINTPGLHFLVSIIEHKSLSAPVGGGEAIS